MTYTLENIPDDLDRALREKAAAEHKSLDATIIELLANGVGMPQTTRRAPAKLRDLSGIAGLNLITDEMKAIFDEQRQIDSELWK